MSSVISQKNSEALRIVGDLTSNGKASAHWSLECKPGSKTVQLMVRSDDGQFSAQQVLDEKDIKALSNWLNEVNQTMDS